MDLSAILAPAEIECYCNPGRNHVDAASHLAQIAATAVGRSSEDSFNWSLKLKNTLDRYEELAKDDPSWGILALIINCELGLFILNASTQLRQNPFLAHWVEAIQRSMKHVTETVPKRRADGSTDCEISTQDIFQVRVELIKCLLSGEEVECISSMTPKDLYSTFKEKGTKEKFNLQLYIQMLQEEGVYEKTNDTNGAQYPHREVEPVRPSPERWKEDISNKIREQPESAAQDLAHLPIELPYLDFLTTILTSQTLESHSIDPVPIVLSYLQHALRLIEQMGESPGLASEYEGTTAQEASESRNGRGVLEYGKDAQTRAVRLLLLFIKSLIRKKLVEMEVLYFEIQEVCVRYVWIKEVREFRGWLENGAGEGLAG